MITLGQAAKETGKSKTAIANAIKDGRLSAERLEGGQYRIDPAELFRVYRPVGRRVDSKGVQSVTPKDDAGLQRETELLRELVSQIKEERDDLRRRLDEEAEERRRAADEIRRLTLMLTDQRQPEPKPEGASPAVATEGKGRLWEKLFGRKS